MFSFNIFNRAYDPLIAGWAPEGQLMLLTGTCYDGIWLSSRPSGTCGDMATVNWSLGGTTSAPATQCYCGITRINCINHKQSIDERKTMMYEWQLIIRLMNCMALNECHSVVIERIDWSSSTSLLSTITSSYYWAEIDRSNAYSRSLSPSNVQPITSVESVLIRLKDMALRLSLIS